MYPFLFAERPFSEKDVWKCDRHPFSAKPLSTAFVGRRPPVCPWFLLPPDSFLPFPTAEKALPHPCLTVESVANTHTHPSRAFTWMFLFGAYRLNRFTHKCSAPFPANVTLCSRETPLRKMCFPTDALSCVPLFLWAWCFVLCFCLQDFVFFFSLSRGVFNQHMTICLALFWFFFFFFALFCAPIFAGAGAVVKGRGSLLLKWKKNGA